MRVEVELSVGEGDVVAIAEELVKGLRDQGVEGAGIDLERRTIQVTIDAPDKPGAVARAVDMVV